MTYPCPSLPPCLQSILQQSGTARLQHNLNRIANVTWYINGSEVQTDLSVMSANYTNSTAGIGTYNVTASASDIYDSAENPGTGRNLPICISCKRLRVWQLCSGLEGVLIQNEATRTQRSPQDTTGTGLVNGLTTSATPKMVSIQTTWRLQSAVQIIQVPIRHYSIPPHLPQSPLLLCWQAIST